MKACRKHITMKQKFLGSIPSGFQWILEESQGKPEGMLPLLRKCSG
jgi:hypothetical protein